MRTEYRTELIRRYEQRIAHLKGVLTTKRAESTRRAIESAIRELRDVVTVLRNPELCQ